MKFFFDTIKTISLDNLAEMFDDVMPSGDDTMMRTSLLSDIAMNVMDITVDGNHMGTLVGLRWFLEELHSEGAAAYAEEEEGYDVKTWLSGWSAIHKASFEIDPTDTCCVNITE
jgi:hypothetical protein